MGLKGMLTEGHEKVSVNFIDELGGLSVAGALAIFVVEAEAHKRQRCHKKGYTP